MTSSDHTGSKWYTWDLEESGGGKERVVLLFPGVSVRHVTHVESRSHDNMKIAAS